MFFYTFPNCSINSNNKNLSFLFLVLKNAFDAFDQEKKGCISTQMVSSYKQNPVNYNEKKILILFCEI